MPTPDDLVSTTYNVEIDAGMRDRMTLSSGFLELLVEDLKNYDVIIHRESTLTIRMQRAYYSMAVHMGVSAVYASGPNSYTRFEYELPDLQERVLTHVRKEFLIT